MKKFKDFLEARNWRDWPPEEPADDFEFQQFAQQEQDVGKLKQEINRYNRETGQTMSVSISGDGGRDSDHFVLYIDGQEISRGDLPEIMQRINQIRREEGL